MRDPVQIADWPMPDLPLSPAIRSGNHLFLTGMTGSHADGTISDDPAAQFDAIFDKIARVLTAAGATLDAVVEMTSYHIAMADHFSAFDAVVRNRLVAPYPACTAVEVAGLRRPGALAEIRVIAQSALDA